MYEVGTFGVKSSESHFTTDLEKEEVKNDKKGKKRTPREEIKESPSKGFLCFGKSNAKTPNKKNQKNNESEEESSDEEGEDLTEEEKASRALFENTCISDIGVNFIQWDFNNYEAKEFRLQNPSKRLISRTSYKKYPRYLNKVENYKFKYTYVNIQFEKYTFSISVFDKPRELKEKIAEISNQEHLKKNSIVIQLKNKESYIYGDELLIDFEPIYNALIKSITLKLVILRKSQGEEKEHNIKFWVKEGKDEFNEWQQKRNQLPQEFDENPGSLHLFDLNERVEIDIKEFYHLHSIIDGLEIEDHKFKNNRDLFNYSDNSKEEIFYSYFEDEEAFDNFFEKRVKPIEKERLGRLSKRFKSKSDRFFIAFELSIYEGSFKIAQANCFPIIPFKDKGKEVNLKVRFMNTTQDKNELYYYQLRKNARLAVNVWCIDMNKRCFCLGSAGMNLFTEKAYLKQNNYDVYLWPMQSFKEDLNCYGMNRIGPEEKRPRISIELQDHSRPIMLGKYNFKKPLPKDFDYDESNEESTRYYEHTKAIKENREKRFNYHQKSLDSDESFLPLFMRSDNLTDKNDESYQRESDGIDPDTALGLLERSNIKVSTLSNRALADYMPQLVQALKTEPFHESYLGEILLHRALESPRVVGHAYFWAINASLYDRYSFERLYLHYERFLFLCSDYRKHLFFQSKINDIILKVSKMSSSHSSQKEKDDLEVHLCKEMGDNIQKLQASLEYDYFTLPHIPDTPFSRVTKIDILTTSKQDVLILTCEVMSQSDKGIGDDNEDIPDPEENLNEHKHPTGQQLKVLFKEGDDLRKDQVVMQIFKIFDELCLEQNMNLFMTPYKVLASGFKLGYIEFVENAIDLVKIHKKYSYNCGISIHNKCLINYLTTKIEREVERERSHTQSALITQDDPDNDKNLKSPEEEKNEIRALTEKKFKEYINKFLRSTAGSIVASYILDLGDRHSGNILIQDDDCLLFHIDFGHILGHKKSKFGFKREIEPFIYLEEMHQLINYDYCGNKEIANKNYEDFQEFCCEGFKIARENFLLVYNLLNLLVPANIVELDKESIHKTIKNFHLELSDNEAKYEMRQMIKKAHKVYRRQFDNCFRLHCDWTKKIGSRWYCCWFRGLKRIFKKKKKSKKVVEIEAENKALVGDRNKVDEEE